MPTLVKTLRNNRKVIFDTGNFDNWCVYVVEADGSKKAPFDTTYFSDLLTISDQYSNNKVYRDFVAIYDLVTRDIDKNVLDLIDKMAKTYHPNHQIKVEQWLTVLYAGMIAEENKENAKLKKRIKRLAMLQVFILGISPNDAASFSKGKKWRDPDTIMKVHGF